MKRGSEERSYLSKPLISATFTKSFTVNKNESSTNRSNRSRIFFFIYFLAATKTNAIFWLIFPKFHCLVCSLYRFMPHICMIRWNCMHGHWINCWSRSKESDHLPTKWYTRLPRMVHESLKRSSKIAHIKVSYQICFRLFAMPSNLSYRSVIVIGHCI